MGAKGHNNPPVELSREEAQFVADVLERDCAQALQGLIMVQEGKLSMKAAEKLVAYAERAKPILRKIKDQL